MGTEWIEDVAGIFAAIIHAAELVDLKSVDSRVDVVKFTNHFCKVTNFLLELHATGRF